MELLWLTGLVVACLAGVLLAVVQLPGTWLILAVAIAYSWLGDWDRLTPTVLCVLAGMAVIGELVEFAASALVVRRAGASRRASWYALGGGFIGMFVFSLPLPVIGTVAGGVIGCFVGAVIGEMTVRDDMMGAARVGLLAAAGRALGTVGKLLVAVAMAALCIALAVASALAVE
ncbi:MAG: DUF456 domain-containing protein [Phycisphaerales bacterium]|nr:MAG: DUF456 domain-containing protein [Phycisphaerales bacterium]